VIIACYIVGGIRTGYLPLYYGHTGGIYTGYVRNGYHVRWCHCGRVYVEKGTWITLHIVNNYNPSTGIYKYNIPPKHIPNPV
jgi:hypothetical protein